MKVLSREKNHWSLDRRTSEHHTADDYLCSRIAFEFHGGVVKNTGKVICQPGPPHVQWFITIPQCEVSDSNIACQNLSSRDPSHQTMSGTRDELVNNGSRRPDDQEKATLGNSFKRLRIAQTTALPIPEWASSRCRGYLESAQ